MLDEPNMRSGDDGGRGLTSSAIKSQARWSIIVTADRVAVINMHGNQLIR